ncbi:MAG: leucine-rich repeat domain-containing protein [Dysgonamonadaceae bacterium]|jgi:hypothetical protein|nr:leucine-rich repeat domain-containing protein [Dysgonamonadaceae bacterium]
MSVKAVTKTVNVSSAGLLKSGLTTDERTTVNNLTVTGMIDARDVKFMRDEMTVLDTLDLSAAQIVEYTGTAGTRSPYQSGTYVYPSSVMPQFSFYNENYSGKASLKSVKLPSGLSSIGEYAFCQCSGLTYIEMSQNITQIGQWSFAHCNSLSSLDLPATVTSIEEFAFYYCNFVSLILPTNLTSVGYAAFAQCSNLASITLPANLTSYGSYPFDACYNLRTVINLRTVPANIDYYTFYNLYMPSIKLLLPTSTAVSSYMEAYCWKDFDINLGYKVSAIANNNAYGSVSGINDSLYAN